MLQILSLSWIYDLLSFPSKAWAELQSGNISGVLDESFRSHLVIYHVPILKLYLFCGIRVVFLHLCQFVKFWVGVAVFVLIKGSRQGKLLEYLVPCRHFDSLLCVKSDWWPEITRRNYFYAAILCDITFACKELFHVLYWVLELGRCGSEHRHLRNFLVIEGILFAFDKGILKSILEILKFWGRHFIFIIKGFSSLPFWSVFMLGNFKGLFLFVRTSFRFSLFFRLLILIGMRLRRLWLGFVCNFWLTH